MKKHINKIRDAFHGYLGLAFVYFAFVLTKAVGFTQEAKAFGVLIGSAFLGLAINVAFNFLQGLLYGISSKSKEYYIGIIGGLAGGWLSLFVPNQTLAVIMFSTAIGTAIYDLATTKKQ
jgi:hypothetical protein